MRRLLLPLLRFALTASLTLCLASSAGGVAACAQEVSGASGYTVAGTVLNAATGQPMGRAEVILSNDQAVLTASDGTFAFDHVRAGAATLAVWKPGYSGFGGPGVAGGSARVLFLRSPGRSSFADAPPRRIVVGPQMPALTFHLTPLGSISGHLTLSTADPADGIRVNLFRRFLENGHPHWGLVDVEKTRSDGSWRATALPAGHYRVQASASMDGANDPGNSRMPVWGFPALYYPGVTDVGSAGVLILKTGQQIQADMTLVRQRFFPVTIGLRSVPNTPASFEISDPGGHATGLPVHFDFRSGTGHANVPNGSWTLVARVFGAKLLVGRTDFQVAGAPVQVAVTVAELPSIQVVIHRDLPPPSGDEQPGSLWRWVNLSVVPADDVAEGGGIRSMETHDNGATFTVGIFHVGRFWVDTVNPEGAYVASVSSGGTDLASTPLTITPGSPSLPIEITLRNDPGTIAGKVDSPSPGAGGGAGEQQQVWIYAIPLFPTTAQLAEAQLEDNGQFSIGNLTPGAYRVVACDRPEQIDFHSPEGLAAWSGKGQTVTVDPSGTANVELPVIHGEDPE